jgi:MFS family permease
VALAVAFVAVLFVPETVDGPAERRPYRPQAVRAPEGQGPAFWSAGIAAFASFAVMGIFTSVAPTFLATTFHVTDRLIAGVTTFVVFAGAAVAQVVFARLSTRAQIVLGVVFIAAGLVTLAAAAVALVVGLFVGGAVVAGGGVGLLFRASIASAGSLVGPDRRGGVLAAAFLLGYAGMTVPVIAVGAVLLVAPTLPVLVGFVVVVVALTVVAGTRLARRV